MKNQIEREYTLITKMDEVRKKFSVIANLNGKQILLPLYDPFLLAEVIAKEIGWDVRSYGFAYNSMSYSIYNEDDYCVYTQNYGE